MKLAIAKDANPANSEVVSANMVKLKKMRKDGDLSSYQN